MGQMAECGMFQVSSLIILMFRTWLIGFPVTQACALMSWKPTVLAYVSAIHDISRSPVPMSGAGTSTPGPGQQ